MHGQRALTIGLCLILLLAVPLAAEAKEHKGDGKKTPREQLDECLGDRVYPNGPPTCTFDEEGNLIDRRVPGEEEPGTAPDMAGFLFIAVLWALVPMGIAIAVARSRGQSAAVAFLATLVLGWLGLILVIALLKEGASERAAHALDPKRSDPSERIRALAALRDDGLLTEEEFRAKKAQVLGL